jgi:hypothetical protein
VTDGGLIDKTKEQIGNNTKQGEVRQRQREMRPPSSGANMCASHIGAVRGALEYIGIRLPRRGHQKQSGDEEKAQAATVASRSLPVSTYIRMLKQQTGKEDIGRTQARHTRHIPARRTSEQAPLYPMTAMGSSARGRRRAPPGIAAARTSEGGSRENRCREATVGHLHGEVAAGGRTVHGVLQIG